jgi:hypothetical protein
MSTPPQIHTLCYLCLIENTPLEQQGVELHVNCDKCQRPYCEKHASVLESTSCSACLNDFQVTKQDFICSGVEVSHKVDEQGKVIVDEKGEPVRVRRPYQTNSKQIILFGNDWLFSELRMSDLTEEQCEVKLEWHRAHVSYLEQCITAHRITKAHKLAQVRISPAERAAQKQNTTKKREKKQASLEMLAQSLQNMSKADLATLMQRLQESVGGGKS